MYDDDYNPEQDECKINKVTWVVKQFITHLNIKKFRQAYLKAKAAKKEIFLFDGQEILVTYAKYVIEYFDATKGK